LFANASNTMVQTAETTITREALLRRISSIVSSDLDIQSILHQVVALATSVTHSDATLVYLIDHTTNEMVLRASQLPHDAEIGKVRMSMGEGITGWVASHKSVIALARNASSDTRFKPFDSLEEDTYEAFLSVPMIDGGEIVGVINVHHKEAHDHSSDEVALVTFIGEQMRGVIAKARLAERSQSAVRRMEALAAVAQAISGSGYIERILQAISEMVAETLDSAVCSILLVDATAKELTVSAARCSAPDYLNRMPILVEGSLMEHVIRHGNPAIIPNIHNEKRYRYPELARRSGLSSLLAAPLISRGRVIGSINIYTRDERAFSEVEVGFVKVVAGQAAIAIQNAGLMAETLEMKRVLEARKLIDRAKGILQYKHNFTEEEAYLRLRDQSRKLRRSMRDLAEAVILDDDLNRPDTPGGTLKIREPEDDSKKSARPDSMAIPFGRDQEPIAAVVLPAEERH
jgi:signal transduction protein with GAF and PtsI domain